MNKQPLQYWEFYTETETDETIVGVGFFKKPSQSKIYRNLEKQGFINGITTYGYRKKDLVVSN